MKQGTVIILFIVTLFTQLFSQELRTSPNDAFKRGEELTFRVYYDAILTGEVNAGIAKLEVTEDKKKIAGRNTLHIIGTGKTMGAFNFFFKVRDRYESFIDEQTLAPLLFIRRVNEGGWIIKQDLTFDQVKGRVFFQDLKKKKERWVETPRYIQDIISAFYYTRTLDFSDAKPGDRFNVPFILDDSIYTTKIHYEGIDTITTSLGTFRCMAFKPLVLTGNVFKESYPMTLWVSDDKNKIPIFAKSGVLVGTVKLELIKYNGLRNSLNCRVKK